MLKHPQQNGQHYAEWWWFDTLHIRRTGRFLYALMKNSANHSSERAYALGYLTHYTADTVGHAFVNGISGGPYRTHAQRHKVVENYQDVWAYLVYQKGEFIKSNLAANYIIDGDKNKLPRGLNEYILGCIKDTYYESGTRLYGKEINNGDLDTAYRCWLSWFTKVTNDFGLPLPKPYSLSGEVIEAWNRFRDNVRDIINSSGPSRHGRGGLSGFMDVLAAMIVGPILLAAACIDFLMGEITTLGAAPIRFFLSLSYEGLYNSYMNLREGIAMNGLAFPCSEWLGNYITKHMIDSSYKDVYGNSTTSLIQARAFPANRFKLAGLEGESHLVYPWPMLEGEIDTFKGLPDSYCSAQPSHYIDDPKLIFRPGMYEYYRRFVESGTAQTTPSAINAAFSDYAGYVANGGLGNAVDFSCALYNEYLNKSIDTEFADFNLDSDRGYAFKSWRKVNGISLLNSPITDHTQVNVPIETDKKALYTQTDIIFPDRTVL